MFGYLFYLGETDHAITKRFDSWSWINRKTRNVAITGITACTNLLFSSDSPTIQVLFFTLVNLYFAGDQWRKTFSSSHNPKLRSAVIKENPEYNLAYKKIISDFVVYQGSTASSSIGATATSSSNTTTLSS